MDKISKPQQTPPTIVIKAPPTIVIKESLLVVKENKIKSNE